MAGIGPATSPLPRECSTTEPHGRLFCYPVFGAGDETRTRDIQFGKLKLYQLSYPRASILTSANRLKLYTATTFAQSVCYELWWRGKDSNLRTLRERIYSPSPLTTRPPLQT